jgi:predicted ATPase/DNA-binding SARP family transcriptional activator
LLPRLMEYGILGPLEVRRQGQALTLGGAKQRALLAVLLTQPNRVVAVERLTELLWGQDAPATAEHAIEVYVSQLRRVLEPDGAPYQTLVRVAGGYQLQLDLNELDAAQFQELLEAAKYLAPKDALPRLERALRLWRGPALSGFEGEAFSIGEASRLNELRLHAIEERIDACLQLGRHREVIAELMSLTREHPLRERLTGQLMLGLYRSGRQAEASDFYQRIRERLVDEQGMEPGTELQTLLKRILQQDAELTGAGLDHELPAGTVTFLMTDIEESTRAWDASPITAKQAIERHNAIVAENVVTHQGQVVESGREGDSFLAGFMQARDAVECALDTQRALQQEPWPNQSQIRVRIAVHSGEAELQSGHYVGGALYRCARLMAIGHGGQILVSQAAEELVVDMLPDNASLIDLGLHRLRDISRPEHVFQLVHPDLSGKFPPLKSVDPERTNLPVHPTTFIGREKELTEVADLVARARLVTLSGPGGGGKTRLAVQVAARLQDRFADGVWFVDLTPLTDPEVIAQAVANALGIREQGGRPLPTTVTDFLRGRSTLLVFDNCEHMVDSVAAMVASLLAGCPMLRVLTTSRERLRVDGEHVHPVPPLAVPAAGVSISASELTRYESVQLFLDRASQSRSAFEINNQNAPDVAELCRRLDGIPLAIELAAAQVRALSPNEIVRHLDDRFALLASGNRTRLPRQRTLLATLEWSHQLLDEPERTLFRRLAVFSGGFTLEAVESVTADEQFPPAAVAALIARLTDKSLVLAEPGLRGETRYRLLDTIREFALDQLRSSDEGDLFRRRHATFYRDLVDGARVGVKSTDAEKWLDLMGEEHDNARAALAWAVKADRELALQLAEVWTVLWLNRGYLTEGRQWLANALASESLQKEVGANALGSAASPAVQATNVPLLLLAEAKRSAARLAFRQGDLKTAQGNYHDALGLAESLSNPGMIALLMNNLAGLSGARGDLTAARVYLDRGLEIIHENRHSALEIRGYASPVALEAEFNSNLGQVAACVGDYAEARTHYLKSLSYFDGAGGAPRFELLLELAELDLVDGHVEKAGQQIASALEGARRLNAPLLIAAAVNTCAGLAAIALRPHEAMRLSGAAARILETHEAQQKYLSSFDRTMQPGIDDARKLLGPNAEVEWQAGHAMSTDGAIDYAFAELLELASGRSPRSR